MLTMTVDTKNMMAKVLLVSVVAVLVVVAVCGCGCYCRHYCRTRARMRMRIRVGRKMLGGLRPDSQIGGCVPPNHDVDGSTKY